MAQNEVSQNDVYENPLVKRYAGKQMLKIFSPNFKFQNWRKCWTALAEAEMELGLKDDKGQPRITPKMIEELVAAQKTINYKVAEEREAKIRHDVMSHVYEYGTHCPTAQGIIHLGATSMLVDDNTVLIQMREAMKLVKVGLVNTIAKLASFAKEYQGLVCLGYSHYQQAQPVTLGKRATLYLMDLLMDLDGLETAASKIKARGAKGTVGTQASYLELFDGDHDKVKQLDILFSKKIGFDDVFPVTGQTYTRKLDTLVITALAEIAASAYKFAGDLRLTAQRKEMEEPFAKDQVGSSAMAYKRNPMRSERMTSISRSLMGLPATARQTHATQWFERTLDDSAGRRTYIPESFLAADAVLIVYQNITAGMVVYSAQIRKHLIEELPFVATEEIIMDAVKKGGDRQQMHHLLHKHAVDAGTKVKQNAEPNDFFERLAQDEQVPFTQEDLDSMVQNPDRFAGRAEQQTEEFLRDHVQPVLDKYKDLLGKSDATLNV